MLNEPQLIRRIRIELVDLPIVRHKRLEPVPQLVSLDPVHAEPAERGARRNSPVGINVVDVLLDVVEQRDEITVRGSAPVVGDGVGEVLPVGGGTCELGHEHDEALVCPKTHVPAGGPGVTLGALGSAVDLHDHGPLRVGREVSGVVHEGLDKAAVAAGVPEVGGGVGEQACEFGIDFVGGEQCLGL